MGDEARGSGPVREPLLCPSRAVDPSTAVRLSVPRTLVVPDFLAPAEVAALLGAAEAAGYEAIDVNQRYREHDRAMMHDEALAEVIFRRMLPVLEHHGLHRLEIDATGPSSDDYFPHGSAGSWNATSVVPLQRVLHYTTRQAFAPHYDAFEKAEGEEDVMSFYTVLLYLHDTPAGGGTALLRDDTPFVPAEDGKFRAPAEAVLDVVRPEAGKLLVFYHRTLHESQPVTEGDKYVLRTDVRFTRDTASRPSLTEEQRQAREALDEAERLESAGEIQAAIGMYRRVARLDPALAAAYGL